MNYPDGQEARLGDTVKLGKEIGQVVCSIDRKEYTNEFPEEQWDYLNDGILIEFENMGVIHYQKPESELELVSRKK